MPQSLLDHTENGLVIFCGAGVSMVAPTCLPSWWEMNEQVVYALTRQVESFIGKAEAVQLAELINARRNSRQFPPEFQAEIITRHYGSTYFKVLECLDGDTPNDVHRAIAALAKSGHVRAVVTSNFDRVLEAAFMQMDVPINVCYNEAHFESLAEDLRKENAGCHLIKLHGSVDDHLTLVDTLAQRMRGLSPAINSCLQQLLQKYHWLFMGYSGGDLEGNASYLNLRPQASSAVGFTWLVRDSSTKEPLEAVVKLSENYGPKATIKRGELPTWFSEQFNVLIPADLPGSETLTSDQLTARKSEASARIVSHTTEWAAGVGGERAALVLADMLVKSVGEPSVARRLLTQVLDTLAPGEKAYVPVANGLANILLNQDELNEAMELLGQALESIMKDDIRHRAGLLSTMGLIEHKRGAYHKALSHFDALYKHSLEHNDLHQKSIALHNKAMALSSLGELEAAKSSYEEELVIVQELGDAVALAQVLNNMGQLMQQQDQFDEAISVLTQSIELRERLGDDRGVAYCMGNIATVHHRRGDYAAAKASYEKILDRFRRLDDVANEVTTLYNLGDLSRMQRDIALAAQLYKEGLALATTAGLVAERAKGIWKQALIYQEDEQFVTAQKQYAVALEIFQSIGDQANEAEVLNDWGTLLWHTNQLDAAAGVYEKAMVIHQELGHQVQRATVAGNLALVYKQQGAFEQALALLQDKLTIAQALGAKGEFANALYNMGAVQHEQGAVDEAIGSFDAAQQLFVEMGMLDRAIDILATMGLICGHHGKISNSLHWFDQAIPHATSTEKQKMIAERLVNVLQLLLQAGHRDIAMHYVTRLRQVGTEVDIGGA